MWKRRWSAFDKAFSASGQKFCGLKGIVSRDGVLTILLQSWKLSVDPLGVLKF
jgi:hypothetical protein